MLNRNDLVEIDYTNWRGERRTRMIRGPFVLRFGANDWHKEPQWLLGAFCMESGELREFAMSGFQGWRAIAGSNKVRAL